MCLMCNIKHNIMQYIIIINAMCLMWINNMTKYNNNINIIMCNV